MLFKQTSLISIHLHDSVPPTTIEPRSVIPNINPDYPFEIADKEIQQQTSMRLSKFDIRNRVWRERGAGTEEMLGRITGDDDGSGKEVE